MPSQHFNSYMALWEKMVPNVSSYLPNHTQQHYYIMFPHCFQYLTCLSWNDTWIGNLYLYNIYVVSKDLVYMITIHVWCQIIYRFPLIDKNTQIFCLLKILSRNYFLSLTKAIQIIILWLLNLTLNIVKIYHSTLKITLFS